MKLSYLQGKAATISGLEVDRAMSVLQIPGNIPGIREIKVGPEIKVSPTIDRVKKTCTVKVIFSENLYTEIIFEGQPVVNPFIIHWYPQNVVTHYRDRYQYKSERIY